MREGKRWSKLRRGLKAARRHLDTCEGGVVVADGDEPVANVCEECTAALVLVAAVGEEDVEPVN